MRKVSWVHGTGMRRTAGKDLLTTHRMCKVVSYCKRHLAQEENAKRDTSSKSYKSLKNWGHDPLKASDKAGFVVYGKV